MSHKVFKLPNGFSIGQYFSGRDGSCGLCFLYIANYPASVSWSFGKLNNEKNDNIGGELKTREEFIEYMSERYPAIMTYLLFHPELL